MVDNNPIDKHSQFWSNIKTFLRKTRSYQRHKNFHISKHLVSLRLNFKHITTKVEPPSPILKLNVPADQMSDDPLSNNVFMIMGYSSGE